MSVASSCPTPGDIRSSISPCYLLSNLQSDVVYCRAFMVSTSVSSHLIIGPPSHSHHIILHSPFLSNHNITQSHLVTLDSSVQSGLMFSSTHTLISLFLHLRPLAGRQYNLSNHSTDPDQIFSSCYLCQMKAKLKISVHLHMGNYVNQVHHSIKLVTCYFVS